jgi:membrane protein YqaA with SNARE-associated domain
LHKFVLFVQTFAESLGGPGLALVAFLDSSFISLPEVCDLQIVYLTIQHPERWPSYVLSASLGSLIGSYVIYALARKGGEAFLRKRFHERHIDSAMASLQKYGILAIVVPSLLPPPMPFKIFVLLAGVADVKPVTFVVALGLSRLFRYSVEAILAVMYGEQVVGFFKDHVAAVSIGLAGVALVVIAGVMLWRRRRAT